jgi:hypothetical protein
MPCTKFPRKGQKVCETHGGNAPQNKAAGKRKVDMAAAQESVSKLNLRREIDPHVAMLEEVYRAAGVVAYLDEQVRSLPEQEQVWGVTEKVEKSAGEFPGTDTTYAAELNVWIRWWQQERAALAKVAREALAAGVEERRVRLAEQQGALLADVIRRVLGDPELGLSAEQQQKAAPVVARHLRAVA